MSGSHPNIKVPEGYMLLKESELNQIDSQINDISNVINKLKAETFSTSSDLRSASKIRANSGPQSSSELIRKFKDKCGDSTLRSEIENARTECNKNLKKRLQDVQKTQKASHNDLKKKFESSITKCQELYKEQIISEIKPEDLQLDQEHKNSLLDVYRSCLTEELLPRMDVMYQQHCRKLDNSLQQWLSNCISGEARQSDEVKDKIKNINDLLQRMALASQHNIVENHMEDAIRKVSNFTVRTVPRELTCGERIDQAIQGEDYAEALNQALLCLDLEVLKSTLDRMDAESVFSSDIPTPYILSLWQQLLSEELLTNYQLKGPYLLSSVQALNLSCDIVQGNVQLVRDQLNTLIKYIDQTAPLVPRNEFFAFRNAKWAAGQILQQLR